VAYLSCLGNGRTVLAECDGEVGREMDANLFACTRSAACWLGSAPWADLPTVLSAHRVVHGTQTEWLVWSPLVLQNSFPSDTNV
jgi:hypothetical protein